ncbi:MAG: hypothetical protein ACI31G_00245 [Bacilli bacterium]
MNFNKRIIELNLNPKKEIAKIVLSNLIIICLSIVILYFFFNIGFLLLAIVSLLFINYYLFTSYNSLYQKQVRDHEEEFINIMKYFQIYISNGFNVYVSFELISNSCSSWMKNKIDILLKEIDEDKTIKPFYNFSKNFLTLTYENIILTIYQMVDQGSSEQYFNKFNILFDKLVKEQEIQMIEKKKKSIDSLNNLPLFGAGFITIILTFGILSIIGELLNGI